MAANSERWLYIGRSSVALAVLTADLALAVLSSRFRTAPTVSLKQGQYAPYVLVSLFVFYIGDFVALVLESRSRSEIPNFSASFSGVALAIVVAIRLEGFTAQDKTPALYTKVTSWFLLGIVEIYTAVRLGSSHFSPSPYHEIRSFLAAARAVAYISVVILLSLVYGKRYQSLSDSELDGRCSVPEPNQAGESGDAANNDDAINGIAGTDVLGIRMEAKDEVKMLGGWWPFLKKFKIFLKYTWPFGKRSLQIRFVLSVIIVMVQRAIEVVVPFRHADLLNAVTVLADPWGPLRNLVVLQVMDNLILAWTRKLLWIDVELYRIEKLRVESHSHIVRQDAHFHSSIHAADSIKAVDRAQSIHTLLDDLIFAFTPNMVTLVVALGALITRYGPFMGIILMSTVAFYSVLEKRSVKVLTRERDKYITVRENQERRRQDSVHGWATVANYNRVEHEIGQFASAVIAWIQQWRKYYMLASLFGFSQSFVVQNGYLAGYAFVIFEIYSKKATVGDLIAFPGLWRLLQEPTDYFTTLASDKLEEILDATRLRRILERVPDTGDGDEVMDFVSGRVEFQNVSFSYPGSSSQEIDNISFEIKGGSKVAFVGSTGAGKSTILRLLSRSRFCTGGNILIDGQNVNTLKTESLHEHVGMMLQDSFIFNSTVNENLKYPKKDVTDEECRDACRKLGIHDLIMDRAGQYDAATGDRGRNFSGGQQQLIVLARMLIQKPKVVLIDEGTSALDGETEAMVKEIIDEEFAGRTLILVAHRLSSIKHVDRIIVLGKGGKIVEDGSHDELLVKDGEYAKLWGKHIGGKRTSREGTLINV